MYLYCFADYYKIKINSQNIQVPKSVDLLHLWPVHQTEEKYAGVYFSRPKISAAMSHASFDEQVFKFATIVGGFLENWW